MTGMPDNLLRAVSVLPVLLAAKSGCNARHPSWRTNRRGPPTGPWFSHGSFRNGSLMELPSWLLLSWTLVMPGRWTVIPAMMLLDAATYLPDDILVKFDRASMAVSLEARCPLLDYRLFEFAWRLSMGLKRRENSGKWILKRLAYKLVPREFLNRPKAGFSMPIRIGFGGRCESGRPTCWTPECFAMKAG